MYNTIIGAKNQATSTATITADRELLTPDKMDTTPANNLRDLYDLLGEDTVLVPYERGSKRPMRKKWTDTRIKDTRDPSYIRDLQNNNIAVLVGPQSGNLVNVDCDDEMFMHAFLKDNSGICGRTLLSKGERGAHFWFRIIGDYPAKVAKIKDENGKDVGEFRGGKGNSIIAGIHPSGCEYGRNEIHPLEITFDQIQWPEGYSYPWAISADEEIAMRVGPAFEEKKGKASRINTAFFAELVMERRSLIYDEAENWFYLYDPGTGLWKAVSGSVMAETAWEVCLGWLDQQHPEVVDSLKLLFTQRTRLDIVAMLKSKAVDRNFFTTGPHYGDRHLLFHTLDGMMRCIPEAGEGAVTYVTVPCVEEYRSRIQFPCHYLEDPQCPKFDALIRSSFGEENVPFVMKTLGYLLIDGNPGQSIVVVKGPGRSGKSQLAIVLRGIFPEGSWGELRTTHLDGRFEVGFLANKRGAFGLDVNKDFLGVVGAKKIKELTGGDPMDCEFKFANQRVPVKGEKHILITTNDVLRLVPGENVSAWRRRLIILETRAADSSQIVAKLGDVILAEERDAVFTKLMNAGYQASIEIAQNGMLTVPERLSLGGNSAVVLMGDVTTWVGDCVENGEAFYSTRTLYDIHSKWCKERGETPVSRSIFEKTIRHLFNDLGIELSHSIRQGGGFGQCNGYRGLEVKE